MFRISSVNLSSILQTRAVCIAPISRYSSSTQAACKAKEEPKNAAMDFENARPFKEIPLPGTFKFMRAFLPGGDFYKKSTTDLINIFYNRYGPIFRLPNMFGRGEIVVTMTPEDAQIIFRHEGQWPQRRNFDTLVYHREVHRRDVFQGNEGLIATSGEKWGKMRSAVNPIIMQPQNVKLFFNTVLDVNSQFVQRIRDIRDPATHEMPKNFEEVINSLAFETIVAIVLDTRLGLLSKNHDSAESKKIFSNLKKFFDLSYDLEIKPPFWKIIKTPKFHEMMRTLDSLTNICTKYCNEALARMESHVATEEGKEKSVFEKLVRVDKKFAVVMALDMMMAGVDTTSSTLVGILLCIAKNPDKQQKLFEEIRGIRPKKDSPLTQENMRNLPYLRACIKEGIRLYPIIPGTMRRLPVDVVLSGYRIPKNKDIIIGSSLQVRNEKYVPRANEFLPERWLRVEGTRNTLEGQITNRFMYIPFGYGPRMCAGKRIVQMELEVTLANLVRNFIIDFNYPIDKAFKSEFINVPAIPLKFKFEERKE